MQLSLKNFSIMLHFSYFKIFIWKKIKIFLLIIQDNNFPNVTICAEETHIFVSFFPRNNCSIRRVRKVI